MAGKSPLEADVPPPWQQQSRRPRVVLLGQSDPDEVQRVTDDLRPLIEQHCDIVLEDYDGQQEISPESGDLALVFGGDGAMLRAARQIGTAGLPVIGINLGNLGFLADLPPDEVADALPAVVAGQFRVVPHLMFRCDVLHKGEVISSQLGLNETAILGGSPFSLLELDLYVDGELATSYSCDGLIVSTPVGSTAHSLSAGGPILRKDLQAFVILPVSAHTLTVRPLVDSVHRVYEIVVGHPNDATWVVVDGETIHRLDTDDRVCVRRADAEFKMIEIAGHTYYATLREKLGWGGHLRRLGSRRD